MQETLKTLPYWAKRACQAQKQELSFSKKDRWKASGPSLGRKRQGDVGIRLILTAA